MRPLLTTISIEMRGGAGRRFPPSLHSSSGQGLHPLVPLSQSNPESPPTSLTLHPSVVSALYTRRFFDASPLLFPRIDGEKSHRIVFGAPHKLKQPSIWCRALPSESVQIFRLSGNVINRVGCLGQNRLSTLHRVSTSSSLTPSWSSGCILGLFAGPQSFLSPVVLASSQKPQQQLRKYSTLSRQIRWDESRGYCHSSEDRQVNVLRRKNSRHNIFSGWDNESMSCGAAWASTIKCHTRSVPGKFAAPSISLFTASNVSYTGKSLSLATATINKKEFGLHQSDDDSLLGLNPELSDDTRTGHGFQLDAEKEQKTNPAHELYLHSPQQIATFHVSLLLLDDEDEHKDEGLAENIPLVTREDRHSKVDSDFGISCRSCGSRPSFLETVPYEKDQVQVTGTGNRFEKACIHPCIVDQYYDLDPFGLRTLLSSAPSLKSALRSVFSLRRVAHCDVDRRIDNSAHSLPSIVNSQGTRTKLQEADEREEDENREWETLNRLNTLSLLSGTSGKHNALTIPFGVPPLSFPQFDASCTSSSSKMSVIESPKSPYRLFSSGGRTSTRNSNYCINTSSGSDKRFITQPIVQEDNFDPHTPPLSVESSSGAYGSEKDEKFTKKRGVMSNLPSLSTFRQKKGTGSVTTRGTSQDSKSKESDALPVSPSGHSSGDDADFQNYNNNGTANPGLVMQSNALMGEGVARGSSSRHDSPKEYLETGENSLSNIPDPPQPPLMNTSSLMKEPAVTKFTNFPHRPGSIAAASFHGGKNWMVTSRADLEEAEHKSLTKDSMDKGGILLGMIHGLTDIVRFGQKKTSDDSLAAGQAAIEDLVIKLADNEAREYLVSDKEVSSFLSADPPSHVEVAEQESVSNTKTVAAALPYRPGIEAGRYLDAILTRLEYLTSVQSPGGSSANREGVSKLSIVPHLWSLTARLREKCPEELTIEYRPLHVAPDGQCSTNHESLSTPPDYYKKDLGSRRVGSGSAQSKKMGCDTYALRAGDILISLLSDCSSFAHTFAACPSLADLGGMMDRLGEVEIELQASQLRLDWLIQNRRSRASNLTNMGASHEAMASKSATPSARSSKMPLLSCSPLSQDLSMPTPYLPSIQLRTHRTLHEVWKMKQNFYLFLHVLPLSCGGRGAASKGRSSPLSRSNRHNVIQGENEIIPLERVVSKAARTSSEISVVLRRFLAQLYIEKMAAQSRPDKTASDDPDIGEGAVAREMAREILRLFCPFILTSVSPVSSVTGPGERIVNAYGAGPISPHPGGTQPTDPVTSHSTLPKSNSMPPGSSILSRALSVAGGTSTQQAMVPVVLPQIAALTGMRLLSEAYAFANSTSSFSKQLLLEASGFAQIDDSDEETQPGSVATASTSFIQRRRCLAEAAHICVAMLLCPSPATVLNTVNYMHSPSTAFSALLPRNGLSWKSNNVPSMISRSISSWVVASSPSFHPGGCRIGDQVPPQSGPSSSLGALMMDRRLSVTTLLLIDDAICFGFLGFCSNPKLPPPKQASSPAEGSVALHALDAADFDGVSRGEGDGTGAGVLQQLAQMIGITSLREDPIILQMSNKNLMEKSLSRCMNLLMDGIAPQTAASLRALCSLHRELVHLKYGAAAKTSAIVVQRKTDLKGKGEGVGATPNHPGRYTSSIAYSNASQPALSGHAVDTSSNLGILSEPLCNSGVLPRSSSLFPAPCAASEPSKRAAVEKVVNSFLAMFDSSKLTAAVIARILGRNSERLQQISSSPSAYVDLLVSEEFMCLGGVTGEYSPISSCQPLLTVTRAKGSTSSLLRFQSRGVGRLVWRDFIIDQVIQAEEEEAKRIRDFYFAQLKDGIGSSAPTRVSVTASVTQLLMNKMNIEASHDFLDSFGNEDESIRAGTARSTDRDGQVAGGDSASPPTNPCSSASVFRRLWGRVGGAGRAEEASMRSPSFHGMPIYGSPSRMEKQAEALASIPFVAEPAVSLLNDLIILNSFVADVLDVSRASTAAAAAVIGKTEETIPGTSLSSNDERCGLEKGSKEGNGGVENDSESLRLIHNFVAESLRLCSEWCEAWKRLRETSPIPSASNSAWSSFSLGASEGKEDSGKKFYNNTDSMSCGGGGTLSVWSAVDLPRRLLLLQAESLRSLSLILDGQDGASWLFDDWLSQCLVYLRKGAGLELLKPLDLDPSVVWNIDDEALILDTFGKPSEDDGTMNDKSLYQSSVMGFPSGSAVENSDHEGCNPSGFLDIFDVNSNGSSWRYNHSAAESALFLDVDGPRAETLDDFTTEEIGIMASMKPGRFLAVVGNKAQAILRGTGRMGGNASQASSSTRAKSDRGRSEGIPTPDSLLRFKNDPHPSEFTEPTDVDFLESRQPVEENDYEEFRIDYDEVSISVADKGRRNVGLGGSVGRKIGNVKKSISNRIRWSPKDQVPRAEQDRDEADDSEGVLNDEEDWDQEQDPYELDGQSGDKGEITSKSEEVRSKTTRWRRLHQAAARLGQSSTALKGTLSQLLNTESLSPFGMINRWSKNSDEKKVFLAMQRRSQMLREIATLSAVDEKGTSTFYSLGGGVVLRMLAEKTLCDLVRDARVSPHWHYVDGGGEDGRNGDDTTGVNVIVGSGLGRIDDPLATLLRHQGVTENDMNDTTSDEEGFYDDDALLPIDMDPFRTPSICQSEASTISPWRFLPKVDCDGSEVQNSEQVMHMAPPSPLGTRTTGGLRVLGERPGGGAAQRNASIKSTTGAVGGASRGSVGVVAKKLRLGRRKGGKDRRESQDQAFFEEQSSLVEAANFGETDCVEVAEQDPCFQSVSSPASLAAPSFATSNTSYPTTVPDKSRRFRRTQSTKFLEKLRAERLERWKHLSQISRAVGNLGSVVSSVACLRLANETWGEFLNDLVWLIYDHVKQMTPEVVAVNGPLSDAAVKLLPPSVVYYESVRALYNLNMTGSGSTPLSNILHSSSSLDPHRTLPASSKKKVPAHTRSSRNLILANSDALVKGREVYPDGCFPLAVPGADASRVDPLLFVTAPHTAAPAEVAPAVQSAGFHGEVNEKDSAILLRNDRDKELPLKANQNIKPILLKGVKPIEGATWKVQEQSFQPCSTLSQRDSRPLIDIVFIHGLRGCALRTWRMGSRFQGILAGQSPPTTLKSHPGEGLVNATSESIYREETGLNGEDMDHGHGGKDKSFATKSSFLPASKGITTSSCETLANGENLANAPLRQLGLNFKSRFNSMKSRLKSSLSITASSTPTTCVPGSDEQNEMEKGEASMNDTAVSGTTSKKSGSGTVTANGLSGSEKKSVRLIGAKENDGAESKETDFFDPGEDAKENDESSTKYTGQLGWNFPMMYRCGHNYRLAEEPGIYNYWYFLWPRHLLFPDFPVGRILALDYAAPVFTEKSRYKNTDAGSRNSNPSPKIDFEDLASDGVGQNGYRDTSASPSFIQGGSVGGFGLSPSFYSSRKEKLVTQELATIELLGFPIPEEVDSRFLTNGVFMAQLSMMKQLFPMAAAALSTTSQQQEESSPPSPSFPSDFLSVPDTVSLSGNIESGGGMEQRKTRKKHRDTSEMGLEDLGEFLHAKLKKAGIGRRPTLFVAHSMGGLLTELILLRDEEMARNTIGCIFYGTPHHGSPVAENLAFLKSFVTQYARELHPNEPVLAKLHSRFTELIERHPPLRVVVLAETEKSPMPFVGANKMIVPLHSARPHYKCEFYQMEGATHMEVCKPAHRCDKRYNVLQSYFEMDDDDRSEANERL